MRASSKLSAIHAEGAASSTEAPKMMCGMELALVIADVGLALVPSAASQKECSADAWLMLHDALVGRQTLTLLPPLSPFAVWLVNLDTE